jgi:hypothetical protein
VALDPDAAGGDFSNSPAFSNHYSPATADAEAPPFSDHFKNFSESMADLAGRIGGAGVGLAKQIGETEAEAPGAPDQKFFGTRDPDLLGRVASTAASSAQYSGPLGFGIAMGDAVEQRNDAIKDAAGVEMKNPFSGDYRDQAEAQMIKEALQLPPDQRPIFGSEEWQQRQRDLEFSLYQQDLHNLAEKYSGNSDRERDILAAIGADRDVRQDASSLANQQASIANLAYEKSGGGFFPLAAAAGGEFGGGFRDPVTLLSLLASGPERQIAMPAIRRIATTMTEQGAFTGLTTALFEPEVQAFNKQRGEDNGLWPALKDIGGSALFGGVAGGLIEGVKQIGHAFAGSQQQAAIEEFIRQAQSHGPMSPGARKFWDDVQAWENRPQAPAGLLEAPRPPGEPPPKPTKGAAKPPIEVPPGAENLPATTAITPGRIENAELDHLASPPAIPGVPPSEALRVYEGLVQHGENPDTVAPPAPPMHAPPSGPIIVTPDHQGMPERSAGYTGTIDGKPVTYQSFDPRTLGTDAQAFQYKGGADQAGVTHRLASVQRWAPLAAGHVVVFERDNGQQFIVDGHQRLGLARRLAGAQTDGQMPIRFDGALLKESDGWTPADARAIAAKKNIQEGSGEPLDTARVFRDRPDMWDDSLPITSGRLKQAKGLAELSEPAWEMAVNGLVPHNYASLVGRMMPQKENHAAVMAELAKFSPQSENEARMMIADANSAGFARDVQETLFGKEEATRSLMRERAQVYSSVISLLNEDKHVFQTLDREAQRIEAAGNVLVDTNASRAERAGQLSQLIGKLAVRQGPISAALNRAAARVAAGDEKPKDAARAFLSDITDLVGKDGIRLDRFTQDGSQGSEVAETPQEIKAQSDAMERELLATLPARAPVATPAPPPAAPSGLMSTLGTGLPGVDRILADPYVSEAIGNPIINRKNDVPYGAGPNNKDDRITNVDRHVPKTDTVNGVAYDPAKPVVIHEQVEKHVLNRLIAAGVSAEKAYPMAHFGFAEPAEEAWVQTNLGQDAWPEYQAHWAKWLKPIDHENPKNPPKDLFQKPYPHDDDHLAPQDKGSFEASEKAGEPESAQMRAEAERILGLEGMSPAESLARHAVHEAVTAAAQSPSPLDRQIGEIIGKEAPEVLGAAFPSEAGPEGTQQTLVPGVKPVTDADRLRAAAGQPMRGGNAPPAEGGLFDEVGRAQPDIFDMVVDDKGNLREKGDVLQSVSRETYLAKLIGECEV